MHINKHIYIYIYMHTHISIPITPRVSDATHAHARRQVRDRTGLTVGARTSETRASLRL